MASVPDSDPPVFAISADDLTDWTPFFNHKEIQIDVKLDTDAQAQFGPSTTLTPLKCINNFFWGWNFASTSNKDATRLDHDQNVAGFGDSTMMRLSEKATALSDDKFKKSILDLIQVSAPGAVEVDIDTTPSTASTAATTTAPPTTNDTGTTAATGTAATGTAATSTGTASTTTVQVPLRRIMEVLLQLPTPILPQAMAPLRIPPQERLQLPQPELLPILPQGPQRLPAQVPHLLFSMP